MLIQSPKKVRNHYITNSIPRPTQLVWIPSSVIGRLIPVPTNLDGWSDPLTWIDPEWSPGAIESSAPGHPNPASSVIRHDLYAIGLLTQ